jgi:hypothetical protein
MTKHGIPFEKSLISEEDEGTRESIEEVTGHYAISITSNPWLFHVRKR